MHRSKGILTDKSREKDDDDCAYDRTSEIRRVKFRTLLWSGKHSRKQFASECA